MPGYTLLAAGTTLNKRYRIIQLLGQGGFGAVYRAWDQNLNRPCAVKENIDTSANAARQFSQEATLLANLNHPNLPRVTDHFSIPGQGQYLVMDFVEGEDLRDKLERAFEPLPENDVIPWFLQICDALIYLHSQPQPIIHRDIKPSNIRITSQGKVMLVDFGIAKVYDPQVKTTTGAKALTPGYSPPEQYGQGKTDARSDIYALGATMYTMLTGQKPPDSVDILTGVVQPQRPAREVNSKVSAKVSEAIDKAMELERSLRYQGVEEFKAALIDALAARERSEKVKKVFKPAAVFGVIVVLVLFVALISRSCMAGLKPAEEMGTPSVVPVLTAIYLRTLSPQPPGTETQQAVEAALTTTNAEIEPSETTQGTLEATFTPSATEAFLIYVREGPGTNYAWVGGLRNETRFDVVGRNLEGDWLYVRLDSGLEGWVFGEVLRFYTPFSGEAQELPVYKAPETETPPAGKTETKLE